MDKWLQEKKVRRNFKGLVKTLKRRERGKGPQNRKEGSCIGEDLEEASVALGGKDNCGNRSDRPVTKATQTR